MLTIGGEGKTINNVELTINEKYIQGTLTRVGESSMYSSYILKIFLTTGQTLSLEYFDVDFRDVDADLIFDIKEWGKYK